MSFASKPGMAGDKRFVYVLRNADPDPHFYTGLTSDVNARLADHNGGRCRHTVSRRPWQCHVVIAFSDEDRAIRFERDLKSGSGRAFAKRHFEE
jgi:predicted GIY-YIG superfamily endonuclease